MNTATILPITEARKRIFEIADEVENSRNHFMLTARGIPKAIIMSVDEFVSWIETLEVMREFPDLEKDIKQAEQDLATGNYVTLEELLAEEGLILADKSKGKYVPSKSKSKSRKKSKKS